MSAFRAPGFEELVKAKGFDWFFDKTFSGHVDLATIPEAEKQQYIAHWSQPGALTAMGMHKGSGLALACELLAGALTGSGACGPGDRVHNGMLSIYIDPARMNEGWAGEAEPRRHRERRPSLRHQTSLPRAGGAYVYAHAAFGPGVGFLAGVAQCTEPGAGQAECPCEDDWDCPAFTECQVDRSSSWCRGCMP